MSRLSADGALSRRVTEQDRRCVDQSIDAYLAEAGIPPRPRGWAWLIRIPDTFRTGREFLDHASAQLNACDPAPTLPSGWLPVMREAIAWPCVVGK
ncbi:DUF5956 family protein [Arthrobacter sp. STN4]|uniref:DUF5956 family protein n=1 Tax=Arthrobacter sp. STN4 TaxID=2923276 RepID=UPI00211A6EC6|nr:DUF5956 family protein [Arthrobacter sp. STN4]MCQ9164488.1 DUF5956 family protein [Arthrobacter sp. STN4]